MNRAGGKTYKPYIWLKIYLQSIWVTPNVTYWKLKNGQGFEKVFLSREQTNGQMFSE